MNVILAVIVVGVLGDFIILIQNTIALNKLLDVIIDNRDGLIDANKQLATIDSSLLKRVNELQGELDATRLSKSKKRGVK